MQPESQSSASDDKDAKPPSEDSKLTALPPQGFLARARRMLFGAPRDFRDPTVFHKISLIAFLAWVGLGADGLSSSAYGPDECYRALGDAVDKLGFHSHVYYLAVFLALATAVTVLVISVCYRQVIELFPSGGGGYVVATKLLSPAAGVVSGSALLVDYILTITTSVAGGGDALFSMLPAHYANAKLPVEVVILLLLILLNLRGVKESVTALMPVFLAFVVTHLVLILGGIGVHLGDLGTTSHEISHGMSSGLSTFGKFGLFAVFLSAFARGGGTYTGIEAVSNGLPIMREPRVVTGKKTMAYMALSLAFTAGGILACYLLFHVRPEEGKTMNAVLVEAFAGKWRAFGLPVGHVFVVLTLVSEGALLFVAAQTGFIDGPRVMSNMAIDSWLPHRFGSLSDRLTMKDGVLLLGAAAIALLLGTRGSIDALVVMYAINVFVTFSLTMLGMMRHWVQVRRTEALWGRKFVTQLVGFVLCASILTVTVIEKFAEGAWLTLVITAAAIGLCVLIKLHYTSIIGKLRLLDTEFSELPSHDHHGGVPDPKAPTAVLLVTHYNGVGIHSILSIQRTFPGHFRNVIFVSVAVVDSGSFKGADEIDHLKATREEALEKYVALARRLGWNADSRLAVALDAVEGLTKMCISVAREYPRTVFFAGKLLWKRETWFQRILHNETAYQVQRRLQWKGLPMTVLPLRLMDASDGPKHHPQQ